MSLKPKSIKIVSFDMDGTLVEKRYVNSVWLEGIPTLYARKEGIPFEKAKNYIVAEYQKIGDRVPEWYDIHYWLKKFELGIDWKQLLKRYTSLLSTYQEVPAVIENLGKRYKLIIISNAAHEFITIAIQTLNLMKKFSNIFSTVSDFGKTKKDEEVYRSICTVLNVERNEVIHVGDNWDFDYVAPSNAGLSAFYLDREGKTNGSHVVTNLREFEQKLRSM